MIEMQEIFNAIDTFTVNSAPEAIVVAAVILAVGHVINGLFRG